MSPAAAIRLALAAPALVGLCVLCPPLGALAVASAIDSARGRETP